jgi:hypothetical protein
MSIHRSWKGLADFNPPITGGSKMESYIPVIFVMVIGSIGVWLRRLIAEKKTDFELEWLKRSRRIRIPDESFHTSVFNLQLCVSCEEVHADEVCPKCASEVCIPLRRIVRTTRGFEFPIKVGEKPDNVIELRLAGRAVQ